MPLKFPNDADVIAEEAARWRALSPEEWMRSLRGMLDAGEIIIAHSDHPEFSRVYCAEQEELGRQAIKEFIARHA